MERRGRQGGTGVDRRRKERGGKSYKVINWWQRTRRKAYKKGGWMLSNTCDRGPAFLVICSILETRLTSFKTLQYSMKIFSWKRAIKRLRTLSLQICLTFSHAVRLPSQLTKIINNNSVNSHKKLLQLMLINSLAGCLEPRSSEVNFVVLMEPVCRRLLSLSLIFYAIVKYFQALLMFQLSKS